MRENNDELKLDNLPLEDIMLISQFLGNRDLSFFASTNKDYLKSGLEVLRKREKTMKLSLSSLMFTNICYNSQRIFVCGDNDGSRLGLGDCENRKFFTLVPKIPGEIQQVVSGQGHTLVRTNEGLFVSGTSMYGALGLGGKKNKDGYFSNNGYLSNVHDQQTFTPVLHVKGDVIQIAAGILHTVVWTTEGLFTCGENRCGQLGLEDTESRSVLTQVKVPGRILQIAAGGEQTMVLTDQGLFVCGNNKYGQLGLGYENEVNSKLTFVNISCKISQIIISANHHTFIITETGELLSSGADRYNLHGYILYGLGEDRSINSFTKVPVSGKVLQVAAGWRHALIVTHQGLFACGTNQYNQLGAGSFIELRQINAVPGRILQVAAGNLHSMVLTDEGLFTCGNNKFGALGLGLSYVDSCDKFTLVSILPLEMKESISLTRLIHVLEKITEREADKDNNEMASLGFK